MLSLASRNDICADLGAVGLRVIYVDSCVHRELGM